MPRMTSTMKPICKHNCCKFTLYVAFDGIRFFVSPGGSNMHCHHPRLNEEEISFPSKLLTPEDKGIVQDFGKTHANYAIAANLIEARTGKTLSCHKLQWLSGLCDRLNKIDGIKCIDSTTKMTRYLEKNKYEYMQLVHNETNSKIVNQVNLMDKYAHEVQLPNNKKTSFVSESRIPDIKFIISSWHHRITKTKIRSNPRIQQAYLSEGVRVLIQNGNLQEIQWMQKALSAIPKQTRKI